MRDMITAVSIKNLTKVYNNFSLENLQLEIPRGYVTGIVGRNGAGKTTLMKAILSMIRYDGEISVMGESMQEQGAEIKQKIGVVLDPDGYAGDMRIRDVGKMLGKLYRYWDADTYQKYLQTFGIDEKKKVSELSKGMRVKLDLAAALSHQADLFILDEPTAGLDPMVRDEILSLFANIMQDETKTILLSTHITSDLDKIADYIVVMEDGRILIQQARDTLLDEYLLAKGGEATSAQAQRLIGMEKGRFGVSGLIAKSDKPMFNDFVTERPNVEEIMKYFIRREENDDL